MVSIRRMTEADLAAVRALLVQLGYEIDIGEVERRYRMVTEAEDHAAVVGEQDGRIAAFLHVYGRPAFEKPPEAVVQALVVDQPFRGTGIGQAMMRAAEAWALARGFTSMALSSGVSRLQAHAFYDALGYRQEATSYLLRKRLEADTGHCM